MKLGHNNKQEIDRDGQPALGWGARLQRVGNKLVATLSEVPEIVHKAIKSGRYKRVSAELYTGFKHNGKRFKNVLSAISILGADIPAIKGLEDLTTFLGQSTLDSGSFDKVLSFTFNVGETGKIETKLKTDKGDEMEKEKELTAKLSEKDTEIKKLKDQIKADKEIVAKKDQETSVDELKVFCEDCVKSGKMTPASRDILFPKEGTLSFSENEVVITVAKFKDMMKNMGKQIDDKEHGKENKDNTEKTAIQKLTELATTRAKDDKIEFAQAYSLVLTENKELADEYMNAENE